MDSEILSRLELGAKARQDAELLASTLTSLRQDNRDLVSRLTDREEHVKLLESKLTEMNVNLADLSKENLLVVTGRVDEESAALIRKVRKGLAVCLGAVCCLPTFFVCCLLLGCSLVTIC